MTELTERQQLELAAKAGGIEGSYTDYEDDFGRIVGINTGKLQIWNPRTYDSHALQLAVKLGISIRFCAETDSVICSKDVGGFRFEEVDGMDGHGVRSAITRVAAALAIAQGGAA